MTFERDTRYKIHCCNVRNAIIVILCLVLAMILDPAATSCKTDPDNCVFTLTGSEMESGLPPFSAPPFSISNNETVTSFGGMVSQLGSAIIIIPLIAILESVAIAKAFCKCSTFSKYNNYIKNNFSKRKTS